MEKYIKDNKVAVLYSPGYGAGWYTWSHKIECVFHPEIAKLVEIKIEMEEGDIDVPQKEIDTIIKQIEDKAQELFGENFYTGGARDLTIEWLDPGRVFIIHEYDGSESIRFFEDDALVA